MKILDILEAVYSGRWSVIDVANRLNHKHNRTENVMVSDVKIMSDPNMVVAHLDVTAYSRQDATNEVMRYLRKFGIPHTELQDFQELHTNAWVVTMTYDGAQQIIHRTLGEARYYGRHNVDDVLIRLNKIAYDHNSLGNVRILDAIQAPQGLGPGTRVIANLYVVNAESKQDARNEIRLHLKKFGIPYTKITDIRGMRGFNRNVKSWEATMTYNPQGLTEARYYGRHSVEDVRNRLVKIANEHNRSENVRILDAIKGAQDVIAHLYVVSAESKQDAVNEIRLHLKKFGIPYTQITDLEEYSSPLNRRRGQWEATMRYDPS